LRTTSAYGHRHAYTVVLAIFAAIALATLFLITFAARAQERSGPDVNDEVGGGPHVADRLIVTYEDTAGRRPKILRCVPPMSRCGRTLNRRTSRSSRCPQAEAAASEAAAEDALRAAKEELEASPPWPPSTTTMSARTSSSPPMIPYTTSSIT
jgi:hypothetical protein